MSERGDDEQIEDEEEIKNDQTMENLSQKVTFMEARIFKGISKIKSIIKTSLNIKFQEINVDNKSNNIKNNNIKNNNEISVNDRLNKEEKKMVQLIESVNKFCQLSMTAYTQFNEIMFQIKDELKEAKVESQKQENLKDAKQIVKVDETINGEIKLHNAKRQK